MKAFIEVVKFDVEDIVTASEPAQGCLTDSCAEQW